MFNLKNKNVVVIGLGVSGNSALKLLESIGVTVCGRNTTDSDIDAVMSKADLVILSPGIPREQILKMRNIEIWGELELAYRFLESVKAVPPIIGITGTNGKTTTTTFLGEMLQTAGKKVFIGGNIGIPFCDMALEVFNNSKTHYDYILLELSSFQLESTDRFHVNIAIILNLFQNHGERYQTIEEYGLSKFLITKNMTKQDLLIYPLNFPLIAEWAKSQIPRKISINIDIDHLKIDFDLSKFKLPGIHNKINLLFILHIACELKLERIAVQKCIDNFCGVHHRIEFVDGKNKFTAFNDAKSTNWDATLTAVNAMEKKDKKLYLIIGGKKRGHGDSILPSLQILNKSVDRFYLIGEMGNEIEAEIKLKAEYKKLNKLEAVIADIRAEDFDGIILFSPGFPSFDQYLNYEKRGEHFVSLVSP
jgi:UDP-N-acetylmuramoylalanine--D-glutamate ligase